MSASSNPLDDSVSSTAEDDEAVAAFICSPPPPSARRSRTSLEPQMAVKPGAAAKRPRFSKKEQRRIDDCHAGRSTTTTMRSERTSPTTPTNDVSPDLPGSVTSSYEAEMTDCTSSPPSTPTLPDLTPTPTPTRLLLMDKDNGNELDWQLPPQIGAVDRRRPAGRRRPEDRHPGTAGNRSHRSNGLGRREKFGRRFSRPENNGDISLSGAPCPDFVVRADSCVPDVETPDQEKKPETRAASSPTVNPSTKETALTRRLLEPDFDVEAQWRRRRVVRSVSPLLGVVPTRSFLQKPGRRKAGRMEEDSDTWRFPVDRVLSPFYWRDSTIDKVEPSSNVNNNNDYRDRRERALLQSRIITNNTNNNNDDDEADLNVNNNVDGRISRNRATVHHESNKDARKNRSVTPSPLPLPPPPPPPPADDVGDFDRDQSEAKTRQEKKKKKGDRIPFRVDMLREMSYSGDDPDDIPTWAEWVYDTDWLPIKIRLRLLERWDKTNGEYISKLWRRNICSVSIYIILFFGFLFMWLGVWSGFSGGFRDTMLEMGEKLHFIDVDICRNYLLPCSGHGACETLQSPIGKTTFPTIKCQCDAGYQGPFCGRPRFLCKEGELLCEVGADCVDLSGGQFFCRCANGTTCPSLVQVSTPSRASSIRRFASIGRLYAKPSPASFSRFSLLMSFFHPHLLLLPFLLLHPHLLLLPFLLLHPHLFLLPFLLLLSRLLLLLTPLIVSNFFAC